MTQLVLVHGRAQEDKDAVALKGEWVDSLRRGMARAGLELPVPDTAIRFPYYGDTLRDLVRGDTTAAGVIVRGAGVGDEEAAFVAAVLEEIRTERHVTDEQVERELALAAGSEAVERGPQNWPWVRAVLRAMDKHLPLTSAASVALATRDVYLYLRNIGIRDRIETGVRAALQSDAPMVVVGHSLSSVVTYNLLHREGASQGWQVPLYVTVGSPLAVSAIKKLTGRPRHPSCAARWFNAMDPRDVVALHPLDSDHFRVDPLIHNKTDVDNPTENRHGITGYLGDPEVAQHIHTALTQS